MSSGQHLADDALPVAHGKLIHQQALAHPDEVGLTFVAEDGATEDFTWAALDDRSTQLARELQARGLAFGDVLAVRLRNSPEHVLGVFAAWKVGAVPVPVRWDLPEWERERVLGVLQPRLTLDASTLPWLQDSRRHPTEPLPDVVSPRGWGICSSGSTGTPKVILRNAPAVASASPLAMIEASIPLERPQRVLGISPLYHTNGFAGLMYLMDGQPLVLMQRFDARQVVDLIERHRITGFIAATTLLQRLAKLPDIDARDLSSVQWVMQGASVLPEWLGRKWIELVGRDHIFFVYGSTEAIGTTMTTGTEWLRRPGTVGRPLPGQDVRILDLDGNEIGPGEVGEIYMRSPDGQAFEVLGQTAPLPTTADGFISIGDMGWVDEDGYLYIADRRVDMIITGGANVFPAEVEAALNEHPDVADVVVIGLADPEWGRRVHAIVQPADPGAPPSTAALISWAKDRLAPYKVPKAIELIDQIPRTEATKVNRSALVAERESVSTSS